MSRLSRWMQPSPAAWLARVALLAAAYVVLGRFSLSVSQESHIVTIAIFAPEGAALAAVLLFGWRVWPGVFAGQLALAVISGLPWMPALAIAGVNSMEAILAWALFRRLGLSSALRAPRDVIGLLLLIAFVLQPFSALGGHAALLASHVITPDNLPSSLFAWWFGNVMGQFLLAPTLLVLHREWRASMAAGWLATAVVFLALTGALMALMPDNNLAMMLTLTVPLVVVLALNTSLSHALVATTAIAVAALAATRLGLGPFASGRWEDIANLNVFMLSQLFSALVTGMLNEERNRLRQHSWESQKQQMLGTLVGGIAHHLNNALTPILGNIELAGFRLPEDDEEIRPLLDRARDGCLSAADLVKQLLVFSGRDFVSRKEPLNLNQAVSDVTNFLRQTSDPDIEFSIRIAEAPLTIMGDLNHIERVTLNLLHNAMEATAGLPRRVIHVELNRAPADSLRGIPGLTPGQPHARLRIRDNGRGIPDADRARIFDPFFTTKDIGEGTGLGLSFARAVIREHGGVILVESEEGEGASLVVYLPLIAKPG